MAESLSALAGRLVEIRSLRDAARRRARLKALALVLKAPLGRARPARELWDQLLFVRAHADSRDVAKAAERACRHVALTLGTAARNVQRRLVNSAIPGTTTESVFSRSLMAWLAERFPRDVRIAWDDEFAEKLEALLDSVALNAERDGLLERSLSTRDWFVRAFGGQAAALGELMRRLEVMQAAPELTDRIFDELGMTVRWKLPGWNLAARLSTFPARPLFAHARGIERRADAQSMLEQPLPTAQRLSKRDAKRLIDIARFTLAARQRETDPVTYVNPRDVSLFRLERGVDVALFGLKPARRLPVESYVGYMAAKNRQPVAYGGAWMLYERAEIGINIFDAFRGGESSALFAQIMRVYRQRFGVTRFLVDPFQFGADNAEGLSSGAFWFYFRLGFRPVDAALCELAEREWALLAKKRTHRSSLAVLRRLAGDKLELELPADAGRAVPDLAHLALAVTSWIAKECAGDRAAAAKRALQIVKQSLGTLSTARWPADERASFENMCPLIAQIPRLRGWSAPERRDLVAIMRSKGGPREIMFLKRLARHNRLRSELNAIAARAAKELNRFTSEDEA